MKTHCLKNNLNLRIKNQACYSWSGCNGIMAGFCSRASVPKTRHIPLHLLQPWQAQLICRDSHYFLGQCNFTVKVLFWCVRAYALAPNLYVLFLKFSWHFQNRQFISPSACKNSLKRLERMVNMADKHHNVNKKLMHIIHLYVMKDIWLNSKYQAVSKLSVLWYTRTFKL